MSRRRDDARSTNEDACAEIQPCDAKANYGLCYAGDAPGSARSSKMREAMMNSSAEVGFCNQQCFTVLTNAVKATECQKHSNLLVLLYGVATSLVVD